MDASFRYSLTVSAAIHVALILLAGKNAMFDKALEKKPAVVDYFKFSDMKTGQNLKETLEVTLIETPRLKPPARTEQEKDHAGRREEPASLKKVGELRALEKKQEQLKSTKDYANYFQVIREKIRRNLKSRYTGMYAEGEVALFFALNSNGSLDSLEPDDTASTADASLIEIALESIKDASPFPAFPKGLDVPKMSFSLTVSFKKR